MSGEFIPMGEVAERLNLSRPTVRRKLREGEIPGLVLHFGTPRVQRQVFEKWAKTKDR